ncbi:putative fructosyl amino acid oxidasesarcosine oxidase [Exophiala viscosa]|uniref:Fructosyl amino acid oxidasesarcosine oxidase n=1 Tax=Exophiala viscosa TaxID=2486360 RepID=A0AAN6E0T9_9EURO|nr:putative fructosyl amino acid oxidasesarcosine oxidase [Exophiala viscosa]KAI1623941.1 putative fructosyl amino acid oxidasesarcosine oxidase [Exophiala viscosa]
MGSQAPFPSTVIVIGAGVFGLSTSLALAKRYPATKVIVVDRLTPPVEDGTSVDTTRCIRSDYVDPIYARLAKEAQKKIQEDPDLSRFLFQQGMTFACDGQPSRFTKIWQSTLEKAKTLSGHENIVEQQTREKVYQRIHGEGSQPVPASELEGGSKWNQAYCNLSAAFIDAKECIQIYYDRCMKTPSISFRCGLAVDRIMVVDNRSQGVVLEDGATIPGDMVIVAAGAWSNKLVYLGNRLVPIGHEVAWIKVTEEEQRRWKNMSISTNLSTGLNMFPPYRGEIKILRRSPGYKNTVTVAHPEDSTKQISISWPRTMVSNPTDTIPADAEAAMRANLREIMPDLAGRPFDRSKICWISTTPTGDFLIAPHPSIAGIHLATGGSAHAWKFLPTIGDLVVDSMEGSLPQELVDKWAFRKESKGKDESSPRMDGDPEELGDVVRHHL